MVAHGGGIVKPYRQIRAPRQDWRGGGVVDWCSCAIRAGDGFSIAPKRGAA